MAFTIQLNSIIPSINDFSESAPIGVSALGTPIFDDITFPPGSYVDNDGNEVEYAGLSLNSVKIVVTQSKNIIQTKIAGRDGTFKEYVSLSDFEVNVNAKVTELFNVFPADQLNNWKYLSFIPENIKVVSKFLNEYFEIFDVVIKDFDVSPVVGSLNEVQLNIRMLSDENLDLNNYVR
jgi:hypothetical protein